MSNPEKSTSGFGAQGITFVAILIVCFAFLFALVISGRSPSVPPVDEKRVAEREKTLADTRAKQQALIREYSWANKENKVVRIPIERAMDLVVDDYQD